MAKEHFITRRGTVYEVFPEVRFDSGFYKREFILEVNSTGKDGMDYKDFLRFETTKSFTSMLESVSKGDVVDVSFTLGGRIWQPPNGGDEKVIMYLRCWDVKVAEKKGETLNFKEEKQVPDFAFEATDPGDLPF